MKREEPIAESPRLNGAREMWREEAVAYRRRGADVLVKEAYPIECVRPPQAPVTGGRQASKSRVV